MISINDTKLALRNVLIDSAIIDNCDINFEGIEFFPQGKKLWIKESIQNISQENITECQENFEGIYTLGIFVPKDNGYDEDITRFADILNDLYNPEEPYMNYNKVDVFTHYTELVNLMKDEMWMYRNFNVYFRAVNNLQ